MTDMPDDVIELRDLRVSAFCGVLPEEATHRQPFAFDLDVHVDLAAASASDELADTVDYGSLCAIVAGIAAAERFSPLRAGGQGGQGRQGCHVLLAKKRRKRRIVAALLATTPRAQLPAGAQRHQRQARGRHPRRDEPAEVVA